MDYTKLLRWHAESGADITVAATPHPPTAAPLGLVEVNGENGVTAAGGRNELRRRAGKSPRTLLASTGIYVFNIRALVKLVIEDAFRTRSSHDFTRDVIPASIASHRVSAYNLASADGLPCYWRDVGTIDAYHRSHMELLLVDSAFDPYNDALWPMYAFGNPHAGISCLKQWSSSWSRDSVVSCGSAISGARLVQSVIGPAAYIHETAEVHSSVLLPGVHVGRGARIRRAVIEQGTRIPEGMEIGYDRELDNRRFRVTEGGVVMVTAEGFGVDCGMVEVFQQPANPLDSTVLKEAFNHEVPM
jgi:glucose-1-phosphate adenylyltransferase